MQKMRQNGIWCNIKKAAPSGTTKGRKRKMTINSNNDYNTTKTNSQAWVRVPIMLFSLNIPASAILVAAVLYDKADDYKVKISGSDLAYITKLGRATISRAIKTLKQHEIVLETSTDGRAPTYTLAPIIAPKKRKKTQETQTNTFNVDKYYQFVNDFD